MLQACDLVGAWQLESWTIGYSNRDEFTTPFGEEPEGLLLYTTDGWMSASVGCAGRDRFPEGVSPRGSGEARRAEAYSTYFHYAGRYRVADGDVIHEVSQSLNPNFVGSAQLRHAELDGQTLVLSGKDESAGATRFHTLVWHRAPASPETEKVYLGDG
jgi:hypothetical protein